jgi:chitodextrinase
MFRRFLFAAVAAAPLVVAASAVPGGNPGFVVGFSEDRPKWIGAEAVTPATELGAGAFRVTLQWTPGQTTLSASEAANLDRAAAATENVRVVLTVYGTSAASAPQDPAAREQYCSYVHGVLGRYPAIRDVIIWNEPNKSLFWQPQLGTDGSSAAPAAYEALLAHCYDVLHDAFSDVNVIGLALSPTGNDNAGSHSPGAFIRKVGEAYRVSGRTRPLLDTVAHHVYGVTAAERPWRKHIASKVLSHGDWNKLMYNLWLAFEGTAQPLPGSAGVAIWYMEGGSQTAFDPGKEAAYTGSENVAVIPDYAGGEPESPPPSETSSAPDQYTQVRDSIRLAACQPHVRAYFNFLLIDEARLEGWQSGAYWADHTPKDSLPAFRQAISEATAATVDCDALKGGRPSSDFMPPSTPRDLAATAPPGPPRVDLSWSASNDDASSISYRVYRDGAQVATTAATTWTNTSVAAATTYTYTVRAIDAAGNLGDAAAAVTVTTPVADTTPPETTITAGPSGTVTATTASVEFGSSEAGSRFQCSLDGAPFAGCASPATYTGLGLGEHSFAVRATDAAGNTDPSPAVRSWTIAPPPDTTPPETTITAGPSGTVTATTATFQFGSSEAGSRFECSLDGAPYAACTSPTSYAGLGLGEHSFAVRATDPAGNTDLSPAVRSWTVAPPADTTPPETSITAGPSGTVTAGTASFEFGSSKAGSRFECALDGAPYAECASPRSYAGLGLGAHSFSVRAIDPAGNPDPTPAVRSWTVAPPADTTPPETAITAGPAGTVTATTARFEFGSSEGGAWFECSLDGVPYTVCASPKSYAGLGFGGHSFAVRAIDPAGNPDPTAAVRSWTVAPPADTTPPDTAIDSGPSGAVNSRTVSFAFSANESGALFECAVDAGPFAQCSSPQSYGGLMEGDHSFAVRARDAAGNTDPTPAVRLWTVIDTSLVPPQPEPPPPPPPVSPPPPPSAPPAPIEPSGGGATAGAATPVTLSPPGTVSPAREAASGPATRPMIHVGTPHRDVLQGTAGRDILRGLAGDDVLYGLARNDVLYGGPGRDRLLGGSGSDVVHAGDGARDVISCGVGRDLVYADRADRVGRDCERVRRSRRT